MTAKTAITIVVCAALIRLLGELRLLHGRGYSRRGYLKAVKRRKAANIIMLVSAPAFCALCLLAPVYGLITAEMYTMGTLIVALSDYRRMSKRPQILCPGKIRYRRAAAILMPALLAMWLSTGIPAAAFMFISVFLCANVWIPMWLACKLSD